jgi:hypothetical protein
MYGGYGAHMRVTLSLQRSLDTRALTLPARMYDIANLLSKLIKMTLQKGTT